VNGEAKKIRPKKRWFVSGFFILLALYLLGLQTIPRFPFGPYKIYSDLSAEKEAAIIPYKYLSSEEAYPYVRSKYGDRQTNYDLEIKKWPNAQSCLVETELTKSEPDLRLVNWYRFKTYRDAEVCLWRIFDSLGTPEKVVRWFEFQRSYFKCEYEENNAPSLKSTKISNSVRHHPSALQWKKESTKIVTFQGNWPFNKCRDLVPSRGIKGRLTSKISKGQFVRSVFDDENKIREIELTYYSKL